MNDDPDLSDAYALTSQDALKDLYRTWAHSYDTGFGDGQGFQLPREVARAFVGAGGRGPVLDVGAGTGLLAEQLKSVGIDQIDGVDLSPDMLGVAGMKGIYRDLIEADVTKPLLGTPQYMGIVSSGTFTLGHVGPEGIIALMEAAAPNALFVISVNAKHYDSAGFAAIAWATGNVNFANYLHIPYVPQASELVVVCTAIVGAGLGFLWFNTYPAQVFMGDVGSLALGGALGTIAVLVRQEFVLVIMGGVFVMETLSVILQVGSYKLRGQRIFRMAPIHHHYELKGWPEPRVIVRFWIISIVLVLIGLATLKVR